MSQCHDVLEGSFPDLAAMGATEYDMNFYVVLPFQKPQGFDDASMVLVRPKLSWIEEITLGQMIGLPNTEPCFFCNID
jgi:hypothetical protein